METLVKGQSSLFVVPSSNNAYVPPTLDEHGLEPLEDGLEFTLQREKIERNTLTDTIETVESRLGVKTVTGSIPIEMKAGKLAGEEPRGGILFESLLGTKTKITTETVSGAGHTTTVINLPDTAIGKYKKNFVVLVKEAGKYAARPISAVDETPGAVKITLAIPLDTAPSDGVVIEKVVVYSHDGASPEFAITWHPGGEIREQVTGVKSISASLENWTANSTPSINFAVEGIDIKKDVAQPAITANFANDAKVPVMMGAYAWIGQESVHYVELGLSIENTKADLPSAAAEAGKIGTRKTKFGVTGSINPYMATDNLDRWNVFEKGQATSIFTYAYNPTIVDGEFEHVVAIWMPNVKITNMPTGDQDGVLMDDIEFESFRKEGKDTIFMAFI